MGSFPLSLSLSLSLAPQRPADSYTEHNGCDLAALSRADRDRKKQYRQLSKEGGGERVFKGQGHTNTPPHTPTHTNSHED